MQNIKTILVPTDFSDVAGNALRYAIRLAEESGAGLILFHIYVVPVPTTEVPVAFVPTEELERAGMERLREEGAKAMGTKNIPVEFIVKPGLIVNGILDVINERNPDVVVMGVTGAGKRPGVLMGSNTTSLMKKTKTPVLVVPPQSAFQKTENIVLAYDYSRTLDEKVVKHVRLFADLFKANLQVINAVKPDEKTTYRKAMAYVESEHFLRGINHTVYFPEAEDFVEEINDFVERHQACLLIVVPHEHTFMEAVLHRSSARKLAFLTSVPLLSVHD